jgi:hypothetical protein
MGHSGISRNGDCRFQMDGNHQDPAYSDKTKACYMMSWDSEYLSWNYPALVFSRVGLGFSESTFSQPLLAVEHPLRVCPNYDHHRQFQKIPHPNNEGKSGPEPKPQRNCVNGCITTFLQKLFTVISRCDRLFFSIVVDSRPNLFGRV